MANIEEWETFLLIEGDTDEIKRFYLQATASRPSIQWYEQHLTEDDSRWVKHIRWTIRGTLSFWNFIHPSNDLIYKYYDKKENRVFQRKWNRENWGSAYDVSYASDWFIADAIVNSSSPTDFYKYINQSSFEVRVNKDYSRAILSQDNDRRPMADVQSWQEYFDQLTFKAVILSFHTEDRPTEVFNLIAKEYPTLKFTIQQRERGGMKVSASTIENGKWSTLVEPKSMFETTHDEQTEIYGKCQCTDKDTSTYYWPKECQEREQNKTIIIFNTMLKLIDSGIEDKSVFDGLLSINLDLLPYEYYDMSRKLVRYKNQLVYSPIDFEGLRKEVRTFLEEQAKVNNNQEIPVA